MSICDNQRKAKGLCNGHYERLRLTGNLQEDVPLGLKPKKSCTAKNCSNQIKAKGLCETHYVRLRELGDVHEDIPINGFHSHDEFNVCEVPTCERTVRSRNSPWCEGHYARVRRNGDPEPDRPLGWQRSRPKKIKPQKQKIQQGSKPPKQILRRHEPRPCAAKDCNNTIPKGTFCPKCRARNDRHGDPSIVIPVEERQYKRGSDNHSWSDKPSYDAIHLRIRKTYGKASEHKCIDCHKQAKHWSYSGPNYNTLMPYSDNLDDYRPRCVPCHSIHDKKKGSASGR